ncbi:MAG: DNA polymerase III subunit gamma/tau [Oscillospiraceae bacterium]|nr:DNA polymerase III subunit gamma/tau [Oscillospiraceae bacterium]
MYQALYRKWRPRGFDDVVGQAHITETLKNQVKTGRLSHAYLFVGSRGTGKTTCAKILSRAINCERPEDGNPCNVCPSCAGIENGGILDVLEIDAASNSGVENVRALRDEAVFTPASVKKRVYIIDEVHMLSTAAFNALLKIMEEPPEHLTFILATTEIQKVPATILSRCQRFSFKRIEPEDIAARLSYVAEQESLSLDGGAAALLSRLADGSMRDALSLLDQCSGAGAIDAARVREAIGRLGRDETVRLFASVAARDAAAALQTLDRLYRDGRGMGSVLEELASLARDVLITKLMPRGGSGLISHGFDDGDISELTGKFTDARLFYCLETLEAAARDRTRGGEKLKAELCLLQLCGAALSDGVSALAARVAELEARLDGGAMRAALPAEQTREAPAETSPPPQDADAPPPWDDDDAPPAPEAESPPAPEPGGDLWADILARFQKTADEMTMAILGDANQVAASLDGTTLTVSAKNTFALSSLDKERVSGALKSAAAEALGRPIAVKLELSSDAPKPASEKLDKLKKFSNFNIEE